MAKTPILNGHRTSIFCPICRNFFFRRYKGRCPYCGIRIAYGRELFTNEDIYMDRHGIPYRIKKEGNKFVLKELADNDILELTQTLFKENE